jgi:hypothetical protein
MKDKNKIYFYITIFLLLILIYFNFKFKFSIFKEGVTSQYSQTYKKPDPLPFIVPTPSGWIFNNNIDYPLNTILPIAENSTPQLCVDSCQKDSSCKGVVFDSNSYKCYKKSSFPTLNGGDAMPGAYTYKKQLSYYPAPTGWSFDNNTDYSGNNIGFPSLNSTPQLCVDSCKIDLSCKGVIFDSKTNVCQKKSYMNFSQTRDGAYAYKLLPLPPAPIPLGWTLEEHTDFSGNNLGTAVPNSTPQLCVDSCLNNFSCDGIIFDTYNNSCQKKSYMDVFAKTTGKNGDPQYYKYAYKKCSPEELTKAVDDWGNAINEYYQAIQDGVDADKVYQTSLNDEIKRQVDIVTDPFNKQIKIDNNIIDELNTLKNEYDEYMNNTRITNLRTVLNNNKSTFETSRNKEIDDQAQAEQDIIDANKYTSNYNESVRNSITQQKIEQARGDQMKLNNDNHMSKKNNIDNQLLENIGEYTYSNTLYSDINNINNKLGSQYNDQYTIYNSMNDLSNNFISRIDNNIGDLNNINMNAELLNTKTNDDYGIINNMNSTLLSLKDNTSTLTDKMGNFIGPNPTNVFSTLGPYTNDDTIYKSIDNLKTNMSNKDTMIKKILNKLNFLNYDSYSPIKAPQNVPINDEDIDDLYCTSNYGQKKGVQLCCGQTDVINEENILDQCTKTRPYCRRIDKHSYGICQVTP